MRLLFCDTLDGNDLSLKNIDPADFKGDGSGILLEAGDRAVVANAAGKTAFYVLKEAPGQSDTGILILVPNTNPGDFYWSCCGFTKDLLNVPSGTSFDVMNGSFIPPTGFTGAVIPYSEYSLSGWDKFYTSDGSAYMGYAIVDGILHAVSGSDYYSWNLDNDVFFERHDIDNTHPFDWACSHCIENPVDRSDKIITDYRYVDQLSRFYIDTLEASHIQYQFVAPSTNWLDVLGVDDIPYTGLRHGKWFYGVPPAGSSGFCKTDILTGEVHKLSNIPGAISNNALFLIDFTEEKLYLVSDNGSAYRYTISSDTWETLAAHSASLVWYNIGWKDDVSATVIIPSNDGSVYIYDIFTDTWSTFPYDPSMIVESFTLYYKDIGAIWPFGYAFPEAPVGHGIIRKDNPTRITKT